MMKSKIVERRTVTLPIERISDTGWLDLDELRKFVDECERLQMNGPVRIWWNAGPEDERPRLEMISERKATEGVEDVQ